MLRHMAEDLPPIKSSRIAAALVVRNRVLAYGVNRMHTHPFQAKFGKNKESLFWHAETNAIYNAVRRAEPEILAKADLYVCRIKYANTKKDQFVLGNAKPCIGCQKCITDFGIRRVFYTTESGYECL